MLHMTLARLMKQERKLDEQPIDNILVSRQGVLNFHFCIYGLQDAYKDGFYHGVLQLHNQYPFKPPVLKFFTPSGRFDTNKSICTTFTTFHQETWTSGWNIRSMIIATVSFMTGNQIGYASRNDSKWTKTKYAQQSLAFNLKSPLFCKLFKDKLLKLKINITEQQKMNKYQSKLPTINSSSYLLYILIIFIVFIWGYFNMFVKSQKQQS